MCGICGAIWKTSRGGVSQETLDAATDALVHRGPDDRGTCRRELTREAPLEEKGFAFGHRRLAIVDLSRAGRQPFANDDETVWLTFNGEIYNYVELRRELEKRGRVFRTQTDVEVLLQAYEEYGIDALRKFNGMFAFAIWDARKRRFLLARDRVGKKPLVYRYDGERIIFASELKALKRFPGVPFELDLVALRQYLTYQYVPHPRTIYKGIAKLPPSSFLLWNEGDEPRVQRYWKLENVANFNTNSGVTTQEIERLRAEGSIDAAAFDNETISLNMTTATYEEATRELRRRLENAVRVRMRCDVPFGAFLSAGVDSTIVTGLMRQFSVKKVRTFSIGFAQKEYDETSYARQTAKLFGTDHTEFFVEPCANDFLTKIVAQYDEPFADSSAIPTLCLCETTRREVTVALGGDGGDELFAVYDRYKAFRIAQAMRYAPQSVRNFVVGPLRALIPRGSRQRSPLTRARRLLETLGMEPLEEYLQWIAIFNRGRLHGLLSDEYWRDCAKESDQPFTGVPSAEELDVLDFLGDAWKRFQKRDPVTAISFTDIMTYLPCDILTKVDVASMCYALETRSPLLDPNVLELALQLPLEYKLKGVTGKRILRDACREFLPPEIDKRPKTGFGAPVDEWFRKELNSTLKEVLFDPSTRRSPYFNQSWVEELVKEHESRRFNHGARLWSLLVFRLWEAQQS